MSRTQDCYRAKAVTFGEVVDAAND
jgi:hypothetical protein